LLPEDSKEHSKQKGDGRQTMDHKKHNYAVEFSEFPEGHLCISSSLRFEGCSASLDTTILRPEDIKTLREFLENMNKT